MVSTDIPIRTNKERGDQKNGGESERSGAFSPET